MKFKHNHPKILYFDNIKDLHKKKHRKSISRIIFHGKQINNECIIESRHVEKYITNQKRF